MYVVILYQNQNINCIYSSSNRSVCDYTFIDTVNKLLLVLEHPNRTRSQTGDKYLLTYELQMCTYDKQI